MTALTTTLTEPTEEHLIRQAQSGDRDAFGLLVKRYAGRANGAAYAILRDRDEAMDASQDAFVRAWKHIARFDGRAKFYTWYSTILRNQCISRLRKKSRSHTVELNENTPAPPDTQADPALLAERNERAEKLWQAVLSLPDRHREIIVMSHFMHLSYKQIAASLDIPIGTVMSRLHQARQSLKAKLTGERP